MFLASTSDIIRVVTASAVATLGVHADWTDQLSGAYTPDRTNTAITGAATTTVVPSPAASTYRSVRSLRLNNNHATISNLVTVQHYDGTTSVDLASHTLLAGESLCMGEDGAWRHLTARGGEYDYIQPSKGNLGIAGTIAETMPRELCPEVAQTVTSGTLYQFIIFLVARQVVTNISFCSSSQAAVTPANWFFGIYGSGEGTGRFQFAQTANQTTTAWAANTIKTVALTAPWTVPRTGLYSVCIMMDAATPVNLKGLTGVGNLSGVANRLFYTGGTGMTSTLPLATTTNATIGFNVWAALT